MSKPTDFWDRCPVCRARLQAASRCPRCRMDFLPSLNAAGQAGELSAAAHCRLKLGLRQEAFWDAVRAVQMQRTPQTLQSLAITALAKGYFDLALAVWRELRDLPGNAVKAADNP